MGCRDDRDYKIEREFYLLTEALRLNSWSIRPSGLLLCTDPEIDDKGPTGDDSDFHDETFLARAMQEEISEDAPARRETTTESLAPDTPCILDDMPRAGLISHARSPLTQPWIL
ncbi:hypothetical protein N7492_005211 [Penicillium capsulatum]|uniref:Uncharacterized protein n=1 Tax=Penicillium capsulatum TaxID=69766 RepID=A0A9W9IBE1_9EURO|nr:hypothetical protein N7492_005211 [Penicillium capsulatum]KAJ6135684.1 hypothetical protein N7512_000844 [Penicillium capsulatum]